MGLIPLLKGNRIYLDSNIWLYALEDSPEYSELLVSLFSAAKARSLMVFTSELTLAEVLVRSIRENDAAKQAIYTRAITETNSTKAVSVSRSILVEAARVRGITKLKLPDAIHAATAIASSCTTFLTNDKQFRTVKGLNTLLLSEVSSTATEKA